MKTSSKIIFISTLLTGTSKQTAISGFSQPLGSADADREIERNTPQPQA